MSDQNTRRTGWIPQILFNRRKLHLCYGVSFVWAATQNVDLRLKCLCVEKKRSWWGKWRHEAGDMINVSWISCADVGWCRTVILRLASRAWWLVGLHVEQQWHLVGLCDTTQREKSTGCSALLVFRPVFSVIPHCNYLRIWTVQINPLALLWYWWRSSIQHTFVQNTKTDLKSSHVNIEDSTVSVWKTLNRRCGLSS